MKVVRRTLEATKFDRDSPERNKLNMNPVTSEYMPSQRYMIVSDDGTPRPYSGRTKKEVEAKIAWLEAKENPLEEMRKRKNTK